MTTPADSSRLRWFSSGVVFGVAALLAVGAFFWRRSGTDAVRPGAFVLPLDTASRTGGTWFAQKLVEGSRTFSAGETLKIPAGSRVRIAHVDGRIEDVNGPWRQQLAPTELHGDTLEDFLAVPLSELANLTPMGTTAAAGDVRILSPVGVTRFTDPIVKWVARPETDYDVAIVDPADPMAPPRVAEKVRPPVKLDQLKTPQKRPLQADRVYEVIVRETGSSLMVGGARFLVAKDATTGALPTEPADLLREAVEAMAKKPTRTGDAWLALSALPLAWTETELAVRVRLRVSAELGLADGFAQAQEAAWRLVKN